MKNNKMYVKGLFHKLIVKTLNCMYIFILGSDMNCECTRVSTNVKEGRKEGRKEGSPSSAFVG